MDINKSLKNNLGLLLKSKNTNNAINKNKKFVQSFFNIKTNLGYQTATSNSFFQNSLEPSESENKTLLNKKKIAPINEKEVEYEPKLKIKK